MADRHLTFHVPQEAGPGTLIPLLEAMVHEQVEFNTIASLLDFARLHGLASRQEIPIFATDCGLLERDEAKGIRLSEIGPTLLTLRSEARPDMGHFIIYTGWNAERPLEKTVLWSYRQVIDRLWERCNVAISETVNVLAEEVRNQIQEVFGVDPSFSAKSIRGVRKWLEAVSPPVIQHDLFTRRQFCPPELALLALGWVAQISGGETGIDWLLTPDRRDAICRVCLLEPAALDRVLDWTLPLYPAIVRPGTNAGVYGRFIRFLKWPKLGDLVSHGREKPPAGLAQPS